MVSVTVQPAGLSFAVNPGEDLLTAAQDAGVAVPSACRNGVCELCQATLIAGSAVNTRRQANIPVASPLMLCRTVALGPLELEMKAIMAAGELAPKTLHARVVSVEPISHDVYRVELQLPHSRELPFHAGQYLAVVLPGEDPCYFSIASSPRARYLELHIQAAPDWVSARRVIDALVPGQTIPLQMPHGRACLAAVPERPLLLVAAGTGFAQMKSLVDYLRESRFEEPVTLFWGVRRQEDMYLRSLARDWQDNWSPLRFVPVVGDSADNDWEGHHDQLVRTVLESGADWQRVQVIASGSPVMVYTLMDALLAAGLPQESFFSDVLEYAPRD